MPTSKSPAHIIFRLLAYAVFSLYVLTAILVALWLIFPRWGMHPDEVYIFYVAPQGFAAAGTFVLALALSLVAGLAGLATSLIRRQDHWTLAFIAGLALSLPVPLIVLQMVQHSGSNFLTPTQQRLSAVSSLAGFVLLPILTLVYSPRLRPTRRPRHDRG